VWTGLLSSGYFLDYSLHSKKSVQYKGQFVSIEGGQHDSRNYRAHISGQSSGPGLGPGYPWTGVSCTSIVNSTIVPQEATFLTKF
jgi:hypothetical protein